MQAEQLYYSPEEYLELEVASGDRHEYIDGQIILMTGGLPNHNQIAGNLYATLNFALRRKSYQAFMTDQRLWIPQRRIYTYPDVMAVASPLELQEGRKDTLTNPILIAEVLSKSTQSYDRGGKFAAYRTIPSVQEYILIDQHSVQVNQYIKKESNEWVFRAYEAESDVLALASVPCEISLADLYDKVEFEDSDTSEP
ncbi:MAG: Uma2 family endonuclease [Cyanobacteria bacterium CAN_BIN43]|nr:Uma2 family endonuclease [Cyanobacteria bacterium CAN_BIN43]